MRRFLFVLVAAVPLAAAADAESYTVDPIHSFVYFAIDHQGFSTIYGRFDKSTGKGTLDAAAKKASIEFSIEAASVDTGDFERGNRPRTRDEHLRSADFFNVAEFPRITFKSTGVRFSGDSPSEFDGNLTLLGVTRPFSLKVDRWKCGPNPYSKKPMCGGNLSGSLKRSEYGMKFAIPAIGDEVRVMMNFEAYRD